MTKRGPKADDWKIKFPDFAVDVWYNDDKFTSRQYASPHGCTYMTGARHSQGYPMIAGINSKTNKKIMMTCHRLAYKITHGDPGTQQVLHTCSDMCCVNPHHLILGDATVKMHIMTSAGRHNNGSATRRAYRHKQKNRIYKHSEEEILWVRDPETTTEMIAEKYKITKSQAARRKWSWTNEYFLWLK